MRNLYEAGDIASLSERLSSQPDTAADKVFLNILLESDARLSSEGYESLMSRFPQSLWVPYSLERLTAFHLAEDNLYEAEKCRSRLGREFPDFHGLIDLDQLFAGQKSAEQLPQNPIASDKSLRKIWSVQVGAFYNKKGAEETGRKVISLGKPIYSESRNSKGTITVVKIGNFDNKVDAEKLADRVREKTGLNPVVVVSTGNE